MRERKLNLAGMLRRDSWNSLLLLILEAKHLRLLDCLGMFALHALALKSRAVLLLESDFARKHHLNVSSAVRVVWRKLDAAAQVELDEVAVLVVARVDERATIPANVPLFNHRVRHSTRVEVLHAGTVTLLSFALSCFLHGSGASFLLSATSSDLVRRHDARAFVRPRLSSLRNAERSGRRARRSHDWQ